MRLRLLILKLICRALLPKGIAIAKHYGAYTQRWDIIFCHPDALGVMQGILEKDIPAYTYKVIENLKQRGYP